MTPATLATLIILTFGHHVTIIRDLTPNQCAELTSVIITRETIEENAADEVRETAFLKRCKDDPLPDQMCPHDGQPYRMMLTATQGIMPDADTETLAKCIAQ